MSEEQLLAALRRGDESAFAQLVDEYTPALTRFARSYVPTQALAEDVVQEAWLGVLKGLDKFEGRSSFKTWLYRIVANTAMTRGARERRTVPFSSLGGADDPEGPAVDADRFLGPDHQAAGGWAFAPTPWPAPDESLLAGEGREQILAAIEELPAQQRAVITLRDVEGFPAKEVSELLEISDGNQRVLLHRARTKVRMQLESYFGAVEPNPHAQG
jgi:RNA polymerase sigma-70 factor (ECF subfamily)